MVARGRNPGNRYVSWSFRCEAIHKSCHVFSCLKIAKSRFHQAFREIKGAELPTRFGEEAEIVTRTQALPPELGIKFGASTIPEIVHIYRWKDNHYAEAPESFLPEYDEMIAQRIKDVDSLKDGLRRYGKVIEVAFLYYESGRCTEAWAKYESLRKSILGSRNIGPTGFMEKIDEFLKRKFECEKGK
jgi:hypothetical protein